MTQNEIIRMAREAGMKIYKGGTVKVGDGVVKTKSVISTDLNELERFAALVAAHEREKQAEQEPVAWSQRRKRNLIKHWAFDCDWGDLTEREIDDLELIINAVLNAAPVRTKDLTDEEQLELARSSVGKSRHWLVAAVIAADRRKNK